MYHSLSNFKSQGNFYDVRCKIDASLMLLMTTLKNINVDNVFSNGEHWKARSKGPVAES